MCVVCISICIYNCKWISIGFDSDVFDEDSCLRVSIWDMIWYDSSNNSNLNTCMMLMLMIIILIIIILLQPRRCLQCRASVYTILNHYNKSSVDNLNNVLYKLCNLLTSATTTECRGHTDTNLVMYWMFIYYILSIYILYVCDGDCCVFENFLSVDFPEK